MKFDLFIKIQPQGKAKWEASNLLFFLIKNRGKSKENYTKEKHSAQMMKVKTLQQVVY